MDQTLLALLNQALAHPILDLLMVAVTYGGLLLLLLTVIVLWISGQRRLALAVLAGIVTSLAVALIFQFIALRPRPEEVRLVIPQPAFPSYPSGHAAMAFAVAMVLSLTPRRGWVWLTTFSAALVIALSRVYLGLHYPSDIFGGAVVGVGAGAACYGMMMAANRPHWRWLLWPQIAIVIVVSQMAYLGLIPDARLLKAPADKILHFLLFGAVAFWLNQWLPRSARVGPVPLAILLPFAFALAEEGLQSLSPVRTFDLGDLFSDLMGMVFFWWASERVWRRGPIVPPSRTI